MTKLSVTCDRSVTKLSVTCDRSVVSPGTLVSSTNKTDGQDITAILLKADLNTITVPQNLIGFNLF